jgi:hypothetical protein
MKTAMSWLIASLTFLAALEAFAAPGGPGDTPPPAGASAPAPAAAQRYTFSWPLSGTAPGPRGGSTRGPPLAVETSEALSWRALHEPGITQFERDRRAILAIAGDYRATFDFLEIATYPAGLNRDRPYQSWGTEKIYVDRDEGTFLSLVHILEMRVVQADGSISPPMVQKHWREDWQYQPTKLVEFQGDDHWQMRTLTGHDRQGQWSQTVAQTDDSPRYASLGRWEHSGDFSTWISGDTWRPLPRRESARTDYQVLVGTNRVTVTAHGWLQEENNLKTVLTPQRQPDATHPYLAREYGVARYERLRDADFTAATEYYARTRAFWDRVHSAWLDAFKHDATLTIHDPADPEHGAYARLLDYADQLGADHAPVADESGLIHAALADVGALPARSWMIPKN